MKSGRGRGRGAEGAKRIAGSSLRALEAPPVAPPSFDEAASGKRLATSGIVHIRAPYVRAFYVRVLLSDGVYMQAFYTAFHMSGWGLQGAWDIGSGAGSAFVHIVRSDQNSTNFDGLRPLP